MSAEQSPPPPPAGFPRVSLLRCRGCGRAQPCHRDEIRDLIPAWPQCCGQDVDLFSEAERPRDGDREVVAFPLPLPGSSDGTAVIPKPAPRTPPA